MCQSCAKCAAPRLSAAAAQVPKGERCIIFAGTKRRCDMLEKELRNAGFPVAGAVHGDKDQWQREQSLSRFREASAAAP